MTLYVHHGPRLEPLADGVAQRLASPPDDPFEPIVVAVPTAGIRDWLSRHLAVRLGVTANIEMPFPGRFLAAALGVEAVGDNPWDVERLTWTVLDVLDGGDVDVPGWQRATAARPSRRYELARRIADLFDRYAANRPQVLQHWQTGVPGDGTTRDGMVGGGDGDQLVGKLPASMEWQFRLWRAVRTRIGEPSPAELLPAAVSRMAAGEWPERLPRQVEVFGVNAITPPQLDVLTALGAAGDVHLSVIHPSTVSWEQTAPVGDSTLVTRRRFETSASDRDAKQHHPLLQSWGRVSVETAAMLRGRDGSAVDAVAPSQEDAASTTLLTHVQADLHADRAPTSFSPSPGDGSIQVHACHGTVRQLEVLRDVLGHLFVDDPELQPHDVVVICPDLARFEPFAAAVFGAGTLPVPLAVSDLSLGTENPVAAALATILDALAGRCTSADVLAIAALDPVRRRLSITADDLERFATWAEQLATTWGIDAAHRDEWIEAGIDTGTWESSVESLLVGAAMPAPEARRGFACVVPFDDVSGDDVDVAGRLADLVARLRHVRTALSGCRPVDEWCDVLVEAVALLCATEPTEAWQMAAAMAAIDELRTGAAGSSTQLALDDARAMVDGIVSGRRGRLQLRTGHVTLTGIAPVRNLPAKVICLLGLDEASVRPAGPDGDDVLAVRPCVGEGDRRTERRRVLLDALLASRQQLVITCDGNDVSTNRPMRFAVQLTELLDTIDATLPRRKPGVESPVLVRHPRRAYDERNFNLGGSPAAPTGVFGFDEAMLRGAEHRRSAAANGDELVRRVARWNVDVPVPTTMSLTELVDACTRPARVLLRDGVAARLPGDVERADPNIPLGAGPLAAASIGERLLDRLRSRTSAPFDDVVDEWMAAESLDGATAPRRLGDQALSVVADEVERIITAAADKSGLSVGELLGADGSVAVDTPVSYEGTACSPGREVRGEVRLVDTMGGIAGDTICRLVHRRPKQRAVVGAAIDLAAAVVASGHIGWRAVVASRPDSRSVNPKVHVLEVVAGLGVDGAVAAAERLLAAAVELRVAALRGAVPVFEETTRQLYENGYLDEETLLGNDYVRGDFADAHTAFVWSGTGSAELATLTPSPATLADQIWGSIDALATIDGKPIRSP